MRHILWIGALVALVTVLPGCAAQPMRVSYDLAPGTSVSQYDTYFLAVAPPGEADARHWMIERAIHDDMRAKGYVPVDRAAADLLVSYDMQVAIHRTHRRGQSTSGVIASDGDAVDTISVTIVGAEHQDAPIWRAVSSGEVSPSQLTASLKAAISTIMQGVPVHDHPVHGGSLTKSGG